MSGIWSPLRAGLDTLPRDPRLPSATYVVCSTPRSGSGLLCRALAADGHGGLPAEYLNDRQRSVLAVRWQAGGDARTYVAALRARRSSADGLLGVKVHADQLEHVAREAAAAGWGAGSGADAARHALETLFPGALLVRLRRGDLDRQAVSYWRALHTGEWSRPAGAEPAAAAPVPYSFDGIRAARELIAQGERLWDSVLAPLHERVVEVDYDDLVARYPQVVASLLERVAGVRAEPGSIAPPDSERLAGPETELLLGRFRADEARLDRRPLPAAGRARLPALVRPGRRRADRG